MKLINYQDIWQDYSLPIFYRWRWTMSIGTSNTLIALLAVIITLTGPRSWKIFRFILHHCRNHEISRSGRERFQDIFLCNSESDLGTFTLMLSLLRSWTKYDLGPQKLSKVGVMLIIVFASIHAAIFTALGILLPGWMSAGAGSSIVLSNSNNSTALNLDGGDRRLYSFIAKTSVNLVSDAEQYYRECYEGDAAENCNSLFMRRIEFKEEEVACPFHKEACYRGLPGISLDTGPVPAEFFGINSKASRSITLQKRVISAVLDPSPFIYAEDDQRYHFNFSAFPENHPANSRPESLLFLHRVIKLGPSAPDGYAIDFAFRLQSNDTAVIHPYLSSAAHADLNLIILNKGNMVFQPQCDDPFFEAHEPWTFDSSVYYLSRPPISILALVEEYQLCSSRSGKCTRWMGRLQMLDKSTFKDMEDYSMEGAFLTLLVGAQAMDMLTLWNVRGVAMLSAVGQTFSSNWIQYNLPDNQWKIEVRRWLGWVWLVSNSPS